MRRLAGKFTTGEWGASRGRQATATLVARSSGPLIILRGGTPRSHRAYCPPNPPWPNPLPEEDLYRLATFATTFRSQRGSRRANR